MQTRTFSYSADDSTFEINNRLIEIVRSGLYSGFDPVLQNGLTLYLNHVSTGVETVSINKVLTNPKGLWITKQGVTVKEDDTISIPINPGGAMPRIDLVVGEHYYDSVDGGSPALYTVIQGEMSNTPVAPSLSNPNKQVILGEIYIPQTMSTLLDNGVVYTKADIPAFAGNNYSERLALIEAELEGINTDISSKLEKSSNLSDLPNKSTSRANLGLGEVAVTDFYQASSGDTGSIDAPARFDHKHGADYEPIFSKKTGFNLNVGNQPGTVCAGDDSRLADNRRCNNTFDNASTSRTNLGLGNASTRDFSVAGTENGELNLIARSDHKHDASAIISGEIPSVRIGSLNYGKMSSGQIKLFDHLRTSGYYIGYGAADKTIYCRDDRNVAIGESYIGLSGYRLAVQGSFRAEDFDIVNDTKTGTYHSFRGKGQWSSFSSVLSVQQIDSEIDTDNRACAVRTQMSYTSGSDSHTFFSMMNGWANEIGRIANDDDGVYFFGLNGYSGDSDIRLKQDFKEIEAIAGLAKLNVYDFEWKKSKTRSLGVIAQEVEKVFPDLVNDFTVENERKGIKEGDKGYKYKSVAYSKFVPLLVKAVQELYTEINTLKQNQ